MNILIIDDCEYDVLELSNKLEQVDQSITVSWLSSPDQALEEFTNRDAIPYDVIFLDQHMPGLLGTELLKKLDKTLNRKTTSVLMLTSDVGNDTRAKALVSDCDGFLTKPADMSRLHAILDGSKRRWELSDLPSEMGLYWQLLGNRRSEFDGVLR